VKFVLFCEGWTEKGALPDLLRRWLNSKLPQQVGIQPVRFNGWAEMEKDAANKAKLHLPRMGVIAVIGLLDLYGPSFYRPEHKSVEHRFEFAKRHMEMKANDPRFRQYFAVHDIEAWILSQPGLLPSTVRRKLPGTAGNPETVNFDEPPARLLDRCYREATGRKYKKVTYGAELFRELDPAVVREKCPYFRLMADDLVNMAAKALESSKQRQG
jgi:hypothetical protein